MYIIIWQNKLYSKASGYNTILSELNIYRCNRNIKIMYVMFPLYALSADRTSCILIDSNVNPIPTGCSNLKWTTDGLLKC